LGLICATLVLVLATLSTFAVLGADEAQNYALPLFAAIRETRAPYLQIISRLDFVFIACWLFAVLAVGTIIKHAIDVNIKKARTTYWSAIIAFVLALFLPQEIRFMHVLGIIATVVIPIALILIAKCRRFLSAIVTVCLCLTLTGCWDALDIQERNIVLSTFADYNGGSYELVTEIARIRGIEAELEPLSSHLIARGRNWNDVTDNLNRVSDYQLHLDSMYSLIIGNGLSESPVVFGQFLNKIRGDDRYRKSVFLFTTDEPEVEGLIELEPEHSWFIGASIEKTMENLLRTGRGIDIRVQDILQGISAGNLHFVLPIVRSNEGQTQLGDYAIFKNLQRVGTLPASDKNGLLFLRGRRPTAIYEISGFHIETRLKNRRIIAREDGFDIKLAIDANILYANDIDTAPNYESLERLLAGYILIDTKTEIRRAQEWYGCDYLGFWKIYRAKFNSQFNEMDWNETFVDMDMEVDVDARIRRPIGS
jgi:Ger(x)C family germination protein